MTARAFALAPFLLIVIVSSLFAQSPPSSGAATIDGLLGPDGSLRVPPDFQGTLDARGWRMELGPDGRPTFVRSAHAASMPSPDDIHWENPFGAAIDRVRINAVAVSASDVYVAGDFSLIGDVVARNVARWDGSRWHALGEGVASPVEVLAVEGSDLYAGGFFYQAGKESVRGIAHWDGARWSRMGDENRNGVDGFVESIATQGDEVWVGGWFETIGDAFDAGSLPAHNIAVWNRRTNTWSTLVSGGDTGVTGFVRAIGVRGDAVYLGGSIDSAGGAPMHNLVMWNRSTKTWRDLGAGMGSQNYIAVLLPTDRGLYVAGGLDTIAPGVIVHGIARWDSLTGAFSALGAVPNDGVRGFIGAVQAGEDGIYVSGSFDTVGSVLARRVARWDGATWHALPHAAVAGNTRAMAVAGRRLYLGTEFVDGSEERSALGWLDGGVWSLAPDPIRGGSFMTVNTVAIDGDDIYVSGNFDRVGDVQASNIARWNSVERSWHALGTDSLNGVRGGGIFAMLVYGGKLYVGGSFSEIGDIETNNIAVWDPVRKVWDPLDDGSIAGVNGLVTAIEAKNGLIWVGGEFDTVGTMPIQGLAIWNPSEQLWSSPGLLESQPLISEISVHGIAFGDNVTYLLGSATFITGGGGTGIIQLRGANDYSIVSIDINGWVEVLATKGDDLYIGGSIRGVEGMEANGIARWDGEAWSTLGSEGVEGVNGDVHAITVHGDRIYVGGAFDMAGTVAVGNIAVWNGAAWEPLGSGTGNRVRGMAFDRAGRLYVGGEFATAGGKPALHLARWMKVASSISSPFAPADRSLDLASRPNPVAHDAEIDFTLPTAGLITVTLTNTLGERVATLFRGHADAGRHTIPLDAARLSAGIYYCRVAAGGAVETLKIEIAK